MFITSKTFAYLLEKIPHIDELICIDTNDIKALSCDELCSIDLNTSPMQLPSSINLLRNFHFDLLVNLHADPYVAWLTQNIQSTQTRGRSLLPNGCMDLKGKWLFYFATCVRNRELALTNIVDIWSLLASVKPLPTTRHQLQSDFDVKEKDVYLKAVAEVSALSLISADDPPLFMTYGMAPDDPVPEKNPRGWKVHHVIFGVKLKEKMDALGVESVLKYRGVKTPYRSPADFFIAKLIDK